MHCRRRTPPAESARGSPDAACNHRCAPSVGLQAAHFAATSQLRKRLSCNPSSVTSKLRTSCKVSTTCASRTMALRMRAPAHRAPAAPAPAARAASLLSLQPQALHHPLPTNHRDSGADSCGTLSPALMPTTPLPCCASLATFSGHRRLLSKGRSDMPCTLPFRTSCKRRRNLAKPNAHGSCGSCSHVYMLLHRPAGAQRLPKSELQARTRTCHYPRCTPRPGTQAP